MDFTLDIYRKLLFSLKDNGYSFQTFDNYLEEPKARVIILRHDVDKLPNNSLRFAEIQNEFGISGTYYFRTVPESWDERIILRIHELGHEIGYHYETMDTAQYALGKTGIRDDKEVLIDEAYREFKENLDRFKDLAPVSTICMHGSPRSPHDNKEIWKKYSYRDLGILGEPYFDVDFNDVFYLTDTGRRWDGHKVSVRDKVETKYDMSFHSTQDIIKAAEQDKLPDRMMFTFHPQRWHDNIFSWSKEFVVQNAKNVVKRFFFVK